MVGLAAAVATLMVPMDHRMHSSLRSPAPCMNVFDGVGKAVESAKQVVGGVQKAYEDEDFVPDGYVRASHILFLASEEGDAANKAAVLKQRIEASEIAFGDAALSFSNCPTRDLNGKLGIFQSLSKLTDGTLNSDDGMPYDGADTTAFDALLFSAELNEIHQIDTQWGTHLVMIEERGGMPPADLTSKALNAGVDKAADLIKQAMSSGDGKGGEAPQGGFGGATSASKGRKKKKKRR